MPYQHRLNAGDISSCSDDESPMDLAFCRHREPIFFMLSTSCLASVESIPYNWAVSKARSKSAVLSLSVMFSFRPLSNGEGVRS